MSECYQETQVWFLFPTLKGGSQSPTTLAPGNPHLLLVSLGTPTHMAYTHIDTQIEKIHL